MQTTIIKKESIFTDFEKLSKNRKKEVADFISYLKAKKEIEATKVNVKDKTVEIKSIGGRGNVYKR